MFFSRLFDLNIDFSSASLLLKRYGSKSFSPVFLLFSTNFTSIVDFVRSLLDEVFGFSLPGRLTVWFLDLSKP